jgi:galactokinase
VVVEWDPADPASLEPRDGEKGETESLVRGIAAQFASSAKPNSAKFGEAELAAANGVPIRGWTACGDSTVVTGSGLSSSAACEVLFGTIFNCLYAGGKYTPLDLAKMGQMAENRWFGKPCGLMDQAASASGGAVAIDFKDAANPLVQHIDVDFADFGCTLCVVHTRGSHADLTPDYAAIPAEMKAVAAYFGKKVLREADRERFYAEIGALRAKTGDRAVLRAMHFFAENENVDEEVAALEAKDMPRYLEAVRRSGKSSMELLENCYSILDPKSQGIPITIGVTEGFDKRAVARVHGGGFAGTAQAYIPTEKFSEYKLIMEAIFGADSVTELKIRALGTGEVT